MYLDVKAIIIIIIIINLYWTTFSVVYVIKHRTIGLKEAN